MELVRAKKHYAAAVAGTLLFASVYEAFSHQVYSAYMLCAFLFPLLGGLLPCLLLGALPARHRPDGISRRLYGAGIAALTAGSLFRGALEIYGTTSRLSAVYWAAGSALVLLSLWRWIGMFANGKRDAV